MNILIFGKDGQLGKALQARFEASANWAAKSGLRLHYLGRAECDLSKPDAVSAALEQFKPDCIINAAAYTAVDAAETNDLLANAINAGAPERMAQYAVQHGATFLHYSTDYVFDGSKEGSYLETDARNPLGAYGKSKAAGERVIEHAFLHATQGQYAILRTSWVYGDGGNFIRTMLRLAQERDELKVIADQYGVPTAAAWLAEVSLALAFDRHGALRSFPSGIYHAVPAGETSWHGLACWAVQEASQAGMQFKVDAGAILPIPASEYPLPAPRPMNSRMQTTKLLQQLEAQADVSEWDYGAVTLLRTPWNVGVTDYVRAIARQHTA
jgi:dTDP-4-dehydrorhamnose reductase